MKKTENELYNLWMNVSPIMGWYRLLKIVNRFTNQYDDEDFSYLEELDNDFLKIEKEAKKDYYKLKEEYNKQMFETKKQMKEEYKEWARERRAEFIKQEIKKLEKIIASSYEIYFDQQQRDVPFWLRKAILILNQPEKLTKLYGKLTNELYFLENKKELNESQLSQEEIAHAKNYPFENLIEVNKSGFALCPFHNDKRPSFWIKNNFGYCFSCNESCDTIKFIMKTKDLSFLEAVRLLNNM